MSLHWTPDYSALLASFAYVFCVMAVSEIIRRIGKRPVEFTRKVIHIGVGMWVVGTALLFRTWYFAIIPPATFILINAFSYWRGAIGAMETSDRGNLGTVFFPISFVLLIYYFWNQPVNLVASLMPMTWGDAMASVFGRRYGYYRYTLGRHTRTLEGSAAMLFFSWVATSTALMAMPYLAGRPAINWMLALIYGGAVALASTLAEAVSPGGSDNLTVPAVAALVLAALRH